VIILGGATAGAAIVTHRQPDLAAVAQSTNIRPAPAQASSPGAAEQRRSQ